ncbi:CD82 antigen-like [Neosynchiropus ocellatus]
MDPQLKLLLLKFFSLIWNIFFLALGLSIGGAGLWILYDSGSFIGVASSDQVQLVALCLSLIGAMVIVVSVMGCLGATLENRVLLLTIYVTLLLLLNRLKIQQDLDQTVDDIIINYGTGGNHVDLLLDKVHREGRCCGRSGLSDWLNNEFVRSLNLSGPDVLPCSCFLSHTRDPNARWCSQLQNLTNPQIAAGNVSYAQGCDAPLRDWLQANIATIVGMDFGLLLAQVIYLLLTWLLYRAVRRKAVLVKTEPETGDDQPTERDDIADDDDRFHDDQSLVDQ